VEFNGDWSAEKCFDLHGNMEHVKFFKEIVEFLREKRKITKAKLSFPNDDAVKKSVYLAVNEIEKKWTMPF